MAGSVNRVILVGNLGRDPEVRHTSDGVPIVNLSVATSERWHDRTTGDRRERTEWHRVVIFNESLGEVAQKYLHKGSKVYLEGQLQTRKWTDQQAQERYTSEIVLRSYRGELTILDRPNRATSTARYDSLSSRPDGSSLYTDMGNPSITMPETEDSVQLCGVGRSSKPSRTSHEVEYSKLHSQLKEARQRRPN